MEANLTPQISLVLACFNRAKLLEVSLLSIVKNAPKYPLEIVVVNDGLDSDGTKEICKKFSKVLNIKYYFSGAGNSDGLIQRCPAIPNNIGIRKATGDILILTCPEIVHLNHAIDFLVEPLLNDKKALTIPSKLYFDCKDTFTIEYQNDIVDLKTYTQRNNDAKMSFLLGVWKSEVEKIRGYDEDFIGYAGEDNDFIDRLISNGCKHVETLAQIIHVYHGKRCPEGYQYDNLAWVYNRKLYNDRRGIVKRNEGKTWGDINNTERKRIEANPLPKICHLYWDKSPMSWLQVQTVVTFHKQNPDWEIRVYVPIQPYVVPDNRYVPDYTGVDYWNNVLELPYVQIIPIDVTDYGIDPMIHNILQSDLFRYHILYEFGGVWSDFDVLWIKPIGQLYLFPTLGKVSVLKMGVSICRYKFITGHNNISVIIAQPKHELFSFLLGKCQEILDINKDRNLLEHQVFGTNLWDRLWPTFQDTSNQFMDAVAFQYKTFFPYSIFEMPKLYMGHDLTPIADDCLGIHWFNGHALSKKFVTDKIVNKKCSMSSIITLIKRKVL
jgi:glycosyltransferase involved in cell wall biosynthesis